MPRQWIQRTELTVRTVCIFVAGHAKPSEAVAAETFHTSQTTATDSAAILTASEDVAEFFVRAIRVRLAARTDKQTTYAALAFFRLRANASIGQICKAGAEKSIAILVLLAVVVAVAVDAGQEGATHTLVTIGIGCAELRVVPGACRNEVVLDAEVI